MQGPFFFCSALTITIVREVMKELVRAYGIADFDDKRQQLYRKGYEYANCVPDVCVICRSADQVNRVT